MTTHATVQNRPARNNESGYTLLEVLMAISIFMVGILAIGSMQAAALKGNSTSGGITQAVQLAQEQIEELMSIPYNPAGPAADLDPAQNQTRIDNPIQEVVFGTTYNMTWTVCDDQAPLDAGCTVAAPLDNSIIINVTVRWREFGVNKRVIYDILRTEMI